MEEASFWTLAVFCAAVFVTASSGAIFKPGPWYREMRKPSWTPPDWAFGAVWTVLYIMIAIAGWRAWEIGSGQVLNIAIAVYAVQLFLNAAWSAIFFGMRRMRWALYEVAILWLAVALNIYFFFQIDSVAGWLLVPYLVWVTTAACLNASVLKLNEENGIVTDPTTR